MENEVLDFRDGVQRLSPLVSKQGKFVLKLLDIFQIGLAQLRSEAPTHNPLEGTKNFQVVFRKPRLAQVSQYIQIVQQLFAAVTNVCTPELGLLLMAELDWPLLRPE